MTIDGTIYKPARELTDIASSKLGLSTGVAETLPLPRRVDDSMRVIVMHYREGLKPRESVYPPHSIATIDAATGEIVEARNCLPADLGVAQQPGEPTVGFGLDPEMTGDDFWELTDRFLDISPQVWEIYARGSTQLPSEDLDLVLYYRFLYSRIAKAPLIPYYEAVAADFFEWMDEVQSSRP
jgi:hypothetical protein